MFGSLRHYTESEAEEAWARDNADAYRAIMGGTKMPSQKTIDRTLDLVAGGLVLGLVVGVVAFMALTEKDEA